MIVHINNLVPFEFPNRSSRSVRLLISTLIYILETRGIIMKIEQLNTEFEYFTPKWQMFGLIQFRIIPYIFI